jgi:DNA-binding transcriptional LysR family regulator
MIDDLRALAIFAETIRHKSFRAAARGLNLSPSVVSYHVAQLEKRVGTPLLYRTTRKISLTHEGEILYAHAVDMLAAARQGLEEISSDDSDPCGRMSIMLPSVLIRSPLHQRIAEACRKYARIEFHIQYTDIRQHLVADGIDLAVFIGDMADSSLKSKRVGTLMRKLACSPDYAAKHQPARHPEDLNSWDWIQLEMLPARRMVRKKGEKYEINYSGHVHVDNVEAMTRFCLSGLGVATPPDFLVDTAIQDQRLVELIPDWQVDPLPLVAVWAGNVATNRHTRRILSYLSAP